MASASTQSGGGGGGGTRRVLSNRTDSTAPEDMKRRVFVGLKKLGHLGQYLELLRELFENFGPLDALSTFNGFAFMQFVNEKDAHSAIAALCGKEFYSCKMDVRLVTMRSNKDGDSDKSPLQLQDAVRDRSPIRRPDTTVNLQHPSVPVHKKKAAAGGGQSGRMDSERLREELYLRYYAMLKKQARDTRVVDCIVIASNRSIADYAESVGHKVRNRGLYVDLMFLVSEASLPSALEEATRSGSAYAVVVSIQHQLHRSCTLNILQGTPEEHRNMPLLDALRLLQRHFESTRGLERERQDSELPIRAAEMANVAIRGDPPGLPPASAAASSASARSGGGGGGAGTGNPPHVQPLLELLVDGKQLAPAELELLLDYVRDRRDSALRELCDRRGDGAFSYETAKPAMGDESTSRLYYRSSSPPPVAVSKHHQHNQQHNQQHHQHNQHHHQHNQQQQQQPSPSSPSSSVLRYSLDGPSGDGGGRAGLGLSMGGHAGGHGGGHGGHGGGHGGGLLGHQPGLGSDFGSPPMRRALGGGGSQFRY